MCSTVKVCTLLYQDKVWRPTNAAQRLLDHLAEVNFYSAKDLDGIETTFASMRETLERGRDTYSPHLLTLLANRLDTCHLILDELYRRLKDLSTELVPTHEKLVSILRSMAACNCRKNVSLRLRISSWCIADLCQLVSCWRNSWFPRSAKTDASNDGRWEIFRGRRHNPTRPRNCCAASQSMLDVG